MNDDGNDTDDAGVERAVSAWTEVREDGVPLLCWDNERGETNAVELSPEAAGNLRQEFLNGPSVRHDQQEERGRFDHSGREPEDTEEAERVLREALGDDFPEGFRDD